MENFYHVVAAAKAQIDSGFSRLGSRIDPKNPVDEALVLFTGRSTACADAVLLLAMRGHEIEAASLLRILGEMSVWMRWIAEEDGDIRAREALGMLKRSNWQSFWPEELLRRRAGQLGFEPILKEAMVELSRSRFYTRTGRVPWDHLFSWWNVTAAPSAQDVVYAVCLFIAHVVGALNRRWPDYFPAAESLRALLHWS